MTAQIIK